MQNPQTSDFHVFYQTAAGPSAAFSVRPNTELAWSVTGTLSTGTWQLEESVHANFWQVVASGNANSGGVLQVPASNARVNYRINVLTLPASHRVTCVIAARNADMAPEVQAGWRLARRQRHNQIRDLITAAEFNNPVAAVPWCAPPLWTINTPYVVGSTVRNGAENNIYVCTSAGTSAASGGPLADTPAGITDNTCTWLYVGRSREQTVVPIYSSVVPAADADRMNGFTTAIMNSSLTALGLVNSYSNTTTMRVGTFFGGSVAFDGALAAVLGTNSGLPGTPRPFTNARGGLHFQTDARRYLYLQPTTHTRDRFVIEINGRPIMPGNYSFTSSLGSGGTLLDMTRYGTDVKDVKIYAPGNLNSVVQNIIVQHGELVLTPPRKSDVVLCIEGNLLWRGANLGVIYQPYFIEQLIAKQLGIEHFYINAFEASAANHNSNNSFTRYIERLDAIVALNPDILIIGGFYYDNSFHTPDTAASAARLLQYLQVSRAALPNCTFVVMGTSCFRGDSLSIGAPLSLQELAANTVFNSWQDSNSIFIPILNRIAPETPLQLSGADGWNFQGGGAAPFDSLHPLFRFYPQLAAIVVRAIREFFQRPAPV